MRDPIEEFKAMLRDAGITMPDVPEPIASKAREISYTSLMDMVVSATTHEATTLLLMFQSAQARCKDCTRDDAGKVIENCGSCDRENAVIQRMLLGLVKMASITAVAMMPGARAEREKREALKANDCGHPDCEVHGATRSSSSDLPEGFEKL